MIQVVIIEGGDEFSIPKNRIFVEVELSMPFFNLSGNKKEIENITYIMTLQIDCLTQYSI